MALGLEKGASLRSSRLRTRRGGADSDPMGSMGNLMDVMLVFACGLIIALIAKYNVDISSTSTDLGEPEPLEAELQSQTSDLNGSDSSYQELGQVYQDTETGELYLVRPDGADAGD